MPCLSRYRSWNYVSSTIASLINQKTRKIPLRKESKRIEILVGSSMKNIPVYPVEIKYISDKFSFKTEISKLEKSVLLELPNPNYREIQNNYQHLRDITLKDYDTKSELPILLILGISNYTKIKTPEKARIGLPGEPIAELTKLGWYIVYPGKEHDIKNILFSQTSIHDYEKLCSLDCLRVSEKQDKPDDYVYEKLREQLGRGPGCGWGVRVLRNQFNLERESSAFTKSSAFETGPPLENSLYEILV